MIRTSALIFFLAAATSVGAAEKTFDRTFTVSPGGSLVVEADSATVLVAGGNSNQVVIRMKARGPEDQLAKMTFDATQSGDEVRATMKRTEKQSWLKWGSWNSDGTIQVTVPQNYRVNVRTSGGSVELKDTAGEATLNTSGGDIKAKNLKGEFQARTSGGSVRAESIRGDLDVKTSGGDLHLIDIDGKISGSTSGGSVRCSLVGANRGITARTSGGSIELTLPRGTTGELEASTSGGNVRSELPVTTTSASDSRLAGSINGGGAPIELRTSGGSISVRAAN